MWIKNGEKSHRLIVGYQLASYNSVRSLNWKLLVFNFTLMQLPCNSHTDCIGRLHRQSILILGKVLFCFSSKLPVLLLGSSAAQNSSSSTVEATFKGVGEPFNAPYEWWWTRTSGTALFLNNATKGNFWMYWHRWIYFFFTHSPPSSVQ